MKVPKSWMYISYFSKLSRTPRNLHLLVLIPLVVIETINRPNQLIKKIRELLFQFKALKYPTDNRLQHHSLPEIEILCVAASKDFLMLPLVLKQAIRNSKNTVSRATIIVPDKDFSVLMQTLENHEFFVEIKVLNEDFLIDKVIRDRIYDKFGKRYGWVLQQLLAIKFISMSSEKGVLLINADTVLLREMEWVNNCSRQILMVSTECHEPYYLLLSKIIGSPKRPKRTFITHHMLFQPHLLHEIFTNFGLCCFDCLINTILENVDLNSDSPLCVEFELYAQGISMLHPELCSFRKFSNQSRKRNNDNINKLLEEIESNTPVEWNSISMHDYL